MPELPQGIWLAIALAALAGLGLCIWFLQRTRKQLQASEARADTAERRAAGLGAELSASPLPRLLLTPSTAADSQPDAAALAALLGCDPASPIDTVLLLDRLDETSRARLAPALETLEEQGTAFDLRVRLRDPSRVLRLLGQPSGSKDAGPSAVIWFEDVTETAREEAALKQRAKQSRALVDCLPLAVWYRDEGGKLIDCNRTYATAVDRDIAQAIEEEAEFLGKAKGAVARALAEQARNTGEACRETHHVVIDGARRLMEVCELPFGAKATLGFAIDHTQLEEVQAELGRYNPCPVGDAGESLHRDSHLRPRPAPDVRQQRLCPPLGY